MKLTIGYVGLTHLGVNYAIASAIKGFNVVCYDENLNVISSLKKKKIPFYEKDTEKNLKKRFKQFKFTNKISDLKNCDLIFLSQDVPTDIKGKSNLSVIKKSIKKIIKVIKNKCDLIILCQVPPGFTRSIKWPSNKLYYQVETLIFSNALERAISPERIIVGKYSRKISKKYNFFLSKFKCPVLEMNYESAELAKISINIFLISSITSTNILSEISENIGANWLDISKALKLDKRIGKYAYLKPGLGISGGNLERDLETFKNFLKFNKTYQNYSTNIKEISNHRKDWIYIQFKKITKDFKNLNKIGILGLAYKENTNSIKNSPSISFIKKISLNNKYTINVFDPKIKKLSKYRSINICKNINDVMKNCEILLLATPWKIFKNIKLKKFKNIKAIIDPYNLINLSIDEKKIMYTGMGS
ncbi:nucleotide sugar dehydrogenase [Candidatus Pelagibacter sp.]|nr:nucleotide sugar dehydrogenase [Candidatus Pelagibacter sp.]